MGVAASIAPKTIGVSSSLNILRPATLDIGACEFSISHTYIFERHSSPRAPLVIWGLRPGSGQDGEAHTHTHTRLGVVYLDDLPPVSLACQPQPARGHSLLVPPANPLVNQGCRGRDCRRRGEPRCAGSDLCLAVGPLSLGQPGHRSVYRYMHLPYILV